MTTLVLDAAGSTNTSVFFRVGHTATGGVSISYSEARPVPTRELWLWRNPAALDAVRRGAAESARGEATEVESFAEYAESEIDD